MGGRGREGAAGRGGLCWAAVARRGGAGRAPSWKGGPKTVGQAPQPAAAAALALALARGPRYSRDEQESGSHFLRGLGVGAGARSAGRAARRRPRRLLPWSPMAPGDQWANWRCNAWGECSRVARRAHARACRARRPQPPRTTQPSRHRPRPFAASHPVLFLLFRLRHLQEEQAGAERDRGHPASHLARIEGAKLQGRQRNDLQTRRPPPPCRPGAARLPSAPTRVPPALARPLCRRPLPVAPPSEGGGPAALRQAGARAPPESVWLRARAAGPDCGPADPDGLDCKPGAGGRFWEEAGRF